MKTIGVDWGHGKKLVACEVGGKPYTPNCTLLEFIQRNPGTRIVVESTFESWAWKAKLDCIEAAEQVGSELLCVAPRQTPKVREKLKLPKSDNNDAITIAHIAGDGKSHLSKPKRPQPRPPSHQERVQKASRLKWHKDLTEPFLKHLPPKKDWPVELKDSNNGFAVKVIACAMRVLDEGGGRKDFDRAIGAYQHGYPSLVRAAFYYYRTDAVTRHLAGVAHGKKLTSGKVMLKALSPEEIALHRKGAMRHIRRGTRWIFHQVRNSYKPNKDVAAASAAPETPAAPAAPETPISIPAKKDPFVEAFMAGFSKALGDDR